MSPIGNDTADESDDDQALEQIHDQALVPREETKSENRTDETEKRKAARNRRAGYDRTYRTNLIENVCAHSKKLSNRFNGSLAAFAVADINRCFSM